jgi:nitrogenase subunit NifH
MQGVSLIFGSSFEKRIASQLQASLVRVSCPVLDQISLSAPDSKAAERFRILAGSILENGATVVPRPLTRENLAVMAQKIREETRKKARISVIA